MVIKYVFYIFLLKIFLNGLEIASANIIGDIRDTHR